MTDLFPVTLMDMIVELERELALRRQVYPRWVASGKLKQDKADRQIAVMRAAYLTLQQINGQTPIGGKDKAEELHRWLHDLKFVGMTAAETQA